MADLSGRVSSAWCGRRLAQAGPDTCGAEGAVAVAGPFWAGAEGASPPRSTLSYRDVEELLAERGVTVDHVTACRWVQRFTPEFIEAARLCRHAPGDRVVCR